LHHAADIDRWSHAASPLHSRDARAKLGALLAFLIAVSTTRGGAHAAFAIYASILLVATLIARLPLPALLWRATLVLPFVATFALITWLSGDTPRAIVLVERSLLSGLAALLLIATTPFFDLLRALESLGSHDPVSSSLPVRDF
jgi:cobalt/nickel transport system permease protein